MAASKMWHINMSVQAVTEQCFYKSTRLTTGHYVAAQRCVASLGPSHRTALTILHVVALFIGSIILHTPGSELLECV